jgi:cyanophycinase
MSTKLLPITLLLLVCSAPVLAQQTPEYGPAKGTLLIVGGGALAGTGIEEKFIQLAGGKDKKFVIVPTAGGNRDANGSIHNYKEEEVVRRWRALGLTNVHMLHTPDPKIADSPEFASVLRDANAVWFDGGRQWNLVDSYANTLTEREFFKVLDRGGVIGGSSAGATVQGQFLVRGAVKGPELVIAPEPEHRAGFAFLKKSAIDQHINTRNRWDDIVPLIKQFPELLGIGLSEIPQSSLMVTALKLSAPGKSRSMTTPVSISPGKNHTSFCQQVMCTT